MGACVCEGYFLFCSVVGPSRQIKTRLRVFIGCRNLATYDGKSTISDGWKESTT
jgi:hypothetical protein